MTTKLSDLIGGNVPK